MAYTTVDNPELYFQAKAWTGTGSEIAITFDGSENMQPDWVWLKKRSGSAIHVAHDSVRGATKRLIPNSTDSETTQAQYVKSFDSNGITFGTDTDINASSATVILWGWKAGGSASSNSNGSITSSVSAGSTQGFSIVSYTGNGTDDATVGHGLSQKPDMVIIKARENTSSWATWHKNLTGSDYLLFLDATDAQSQYTTILKNQSSSVLTLGTNSASNANGQGFISYNFHNVKGYSKFGSYTGNGNADGPFVYTGFRPAWVLVRNVTESSMQWVIHDNKRNTFNVTDKELRPDSTDAEVTQTRFDFVSNGFKVRNSSSYVNRSGETKIYMAFAESPFVNSNGIPNNAR